MKPEMTPTYSNMSTHENIAISIFCLFAIAIPTYLLICQTYNIDPSFKSNKINISNKTNLLYKFFIGIGIILFHHTITKLYDLYILGINP